MQRQEYLKDLLEQWLSLPFLLYHIRHRNDEKQKDRAAEHSDPHNGLPGEYAGICRSVRGGRYWLDGSSSHEKDVVGAHDGARGVEVGDAGHIGA